MKSPSVHGFTRIKQRLPGLALAAVLAALAVEIGRLPWLQANGISALTLAIVLGMLVGNTVYPKLAAASAGGVTFSKQTLLRAGIILYGLRLTFQDIAAVGVSGILIDTLVLSSTFVLAWWVGTRVLGLDRKTAMLIGAGSSICGAAAVMATEPVVRGRADQVAVAISTVVVFGTLDIFLYPALYHLNAHYQLFAASPTAYGIYAGSTIHEVAQVLAAGRAIADSAANTAVITKMVRVMMLAPFLIILSSYLSRHDERGRPIDRRWRRVARLDRRGELRTSSCRGLRWDSWRWPGSIRWRVLPHALGEHCGGLGHGLARDGHGGARRSRRMCRPYARRESNRSALAALLFLWLIFGGVAINAGIAAFA